MGATVTTEGFDRIRARLRELSGQLRATSAKAAEVAPASSDVPKAEALMSSGREVFAVDAEMERRAADAFDTRAEREVERVMEGGSGSLAACLVAAAEEIKEIVQGRIDDTEDTPGGKAPLSPEYARWKGQHYPGAPIGRATGALRNGIVARLVGR